MSYMVTVIRYLLLNYELILKSEMVDEQVIMVINVYCLCEVNCIELHINKALGFRKSNDNNNKNTNND